MSFRVNSWTGLRLRHKNESTNSHEMTRIEWLAAASGFKRTHGSLVFVQSLIGLGESKALHDRLSTLTENEISECSRSSFILCSFDDRQPLVQRVVEFFRH